MRLLVATCLLSWLLIAACGTSRKDQHPSSIWSFQNRSTGEYMYDDNGVIKTGKQATDDRFLWIDEATEGAAVRIKNKKTGHYLQIDATGKLMAAEGKTLTDSSMNWYFTGFNFRNMTSCSWYSITNATAGTTQLLAQNGNDVALSEKDRDKDFTTQWTIVREAGTTLPFAIASDSVLDASFLGDRIAKALSPTHIVSNYHGQERNWKLEKDISAYPVFTADNNPMLAALYNMALEETILNLRDDSTFRTGKLWPDTWTRDAVYSIYFAYSWIHTKISLNTLRKQTLKNPKEALQDTGTGGSWPISTDRVVWAIAAWEYYLSTGDLNWLEEAYEGLRYTAEKDIHVAFDENIGLFRGEACSMDWRTHTYPNWFSNENIGESFSAGTNALHYFSYVFLERAGTLLGKNADAIQQWKQYSDRVKKGLQTHFWKEDKGLFAAYLYPSYLDYAASDRVDIMSNGLCALLGVAEPDQIQRIVQQYPLYPYGGSVLYPTIPDDFAYHNKSIWAVWQTPLMFVARSTGNEAVSSHLMKSLIRQGAMFLTHKENMTYDTGFDENTALNSDRQLWSVAAYISMVYRMLFGMEMTAEGIKFSPTLPADLVNGPLTLTNFKYRNAVANIRLSGTGSKIKSIKVNGKAESPDYTLPADAAGTINIEIEMQETGNTAGKMNLVNPGPGKDWSPVEPVLVKEGDLLSWSTETGLTYHLKGPDGDAAANSPYSLTGKKTGYYSVYAINSQGFQSDLSNPVLHTRYQQKIEAESTKKSASDTSVGFVLDRADKPRSLVFELDIPEQGDYSISLRGSNGRGPHDVYCYIRSVLVDEKDAGTFILESSGNWNHWTQSNQLILRGLSKGKHTIRLAFNPEGKGYDNNMSFAKGKDYRNEAQIDYLLLIQL